MSALPEEAALPEETVQRHGRMVNPLEKGDRFDLGQVRRIRELHELRGLVAHIRTAAYVSYDLETSGLNPYETGDLPEWPEPARVALAQYTLPQKGDEWNRQPPTYVVPLYHPESPLIGHWQAVFLRLTEALRDAAVPIVGQNIKFDTRYTYGMTGISLSPQIMWDCLVASHLLDENRPAALKPRAAELFEIPRWDDHDLSTPGAVYRVPLLELEDYGARDTYWSWRLVEAQRYMMYVDADEGEMPESPEDWELAQLGVVAQWSAMPSVAAFGAVEERGILLDRDWVRESIEENEAVAEDRRERLAGRYGEIPGEPSFHSTSLWFKEWAARAVEADDLRVIATTPQGAPQWNKDVLRVLERKGLQVAANLLEYRQATKRLEYLRSWLDLAAPDGTIRSTFNVGKTVTGRLSSSTPNLQQVTKDLKPAFIPRPGYYFVEADYSQIELRIAAFIARCEPMLQAYRNGEDLHRLTASQVARVPLEEVTKAQRQMAKAVNFGLLFGMGPDKLGAYAAVNYGVQMSDEEAVNAYDAFFEAYPELRAWHQKTEAHVSRYGQVTNPVGRVRRNPELNQALNAPVQSFALELAMLGAASIEGVLPGEEGLEDVRLLGSVHDSLMLEVPIADWKRATGRAMRRMMDAHPRLKKMGVDFDVPLGVEASVGTRWGLADVGTIVS